METPRQPDQRPTKEIAVETVENIVSMLVNKPYLVVCRELPHEDESCVITIKADGSDIGKIVGKEGHTANSIRNILSSVGKKNGFKIKVEIQELA